MKIKAAILTQINKPLELVELAAPELKDGQVLVRIAYSGICHSQLNEIRGLKGEDRFLPHTLGHEGSGIVESVGRGVKKVKPGDKVVLTWIKGKGFDVPSTIYKKADGSAVNSGAISTFMTYAVVSENRLVKIQGKMPLKEAALFGCAIPTGAGIVLNSAKIPKGATVAIFGMGGIGLSALLAARSKGAATVIAVDIAINKLKKAMQLGATHIINAKSEDVLPAILRFTQNKGVDLAVECAGVKDSMEKAFNSVRDKGGLCIIAGNLPWQEKISLDPFDLIKGKRIIGTWGGESEIDKDVLFYSREYLSGRLKAGDLISKVYNLRDINKALSESEDEAGRILIDMEAGV
jgi:S-(hydroxymethyl)glutathione dehydrogenase/alcohol dehydrogenase